MAEFQVTGEVECLFCHDCAIHLENHDSNGPFGDHVSGNQLGEDVEGQLLVCDRKEDAEGEDEGQCKDDGEDIGPEWHIRVVNLDSNGSKDEGEGKKGGEPPMRNVSVTSHQAGVDVLLVLD